MHIFEFNRRVLPSMPSETARETALPNPMPRSRPGGYRHRRAFLQLSAALLLEALSCPARPAAKETPPLKIIAFGDSLVAGYGLAADAAFPAVLEKTLRAEGYHVTIVNAGVSGDTASGGQARLDWALGDGADGVILELGANDMLRGVDPGGDQGRARRHSWRAQGAQYQSPDRGHEGRASLGQELQNAFRRDLPGPRQKI